MSGTQTSQKEEEVDRRRGSTKLIIHRRGISSRSVDGNKRV